MSDWRETISTIIAETERNLGSRASYRPAQNKPPPPMYYMPRSPDENTRPPFQQSAGHGIEGATSTSSSHSHSTTAELTRASHARVIDSVKFELDVRSSLIQKQLEAVREEMNAGMHDAERRWLDVAKKIEQSVSSQLESEQKLRTQAESQVRRLQESSSQAQQETYRMVSEFQTTALEHSEVLRRLEQELSSFKITTETKLAEESRRISALEQQKEAGRAFDLPGPSAGMLHQGMQHPMMRLSEVEQALLQEREFRKALEDHVLGLRDAHDNLPALVSSSVQEALGGAGHDEKVKECGRLIVRMGTELMEETKRRQALEAEVQELRMRVSGMEAVSRLPGAGFNTSQLDPDFGTSTFGFESMGPYTYSSYGGGYDPSGLSGAGATCASGGTAYGASGAYRSEMHPATPAPPMPPDFSASQAYSTGPPMGGVGHSGGVGGSGSPPREHSVASRSQDIVGTKLRDLLPSIAAPNQAMAPTTANSAAAAQRLSRQELDARVQQILGRHGQESL
ncbi:hypothetical protein AB1Y20_019064 [Prymnesium parvum]|uniref:Centrosomal protein POC5 n=1 Tax=Prymnesium parvum TaxID=97485 RepID=A0AB34JTX5_PRYPA